MTLITCSHLISKVTANNFSVGLCPSITTDSTPPLTKTHFHSSLSLWISLHQSHLSINTASCSILWWFNTMAYNRKCILCDSVDFRFRNGADKQLENGSNFNTQATICAFLHTNKTPNLGNPLQCHMEIVYMSYFMERNIHVIIDIIRIKGYISLYSIRLVYNYLDCIQLQYHHIDIHQVHLLYSHSQWLYTHYQSRTPLLIVFFFCWVYQCSR